MEEEEGADDKDKYSRQIRLVGRIEEFTYVRMYVLTYTYTTQCMYTQ